jgi:hypothetical protein
MQLLINDASARATLRLSSLRSGLILLLCLPGLCGKEVSRPLPAKEENAIRKQLAGYVDARSNGSGDRQASFYAEDGDEWELGASKKTIGRADIANLLKMPNDPARRFRLEILDITPLASSAALVDAEWFRETSPKPRGRVQYCMVKRHGVWLIRSARINPYPVHR